MSALHFIINVLLPIPVALLAWWMARRSRRASLVTAGSILALLAARPLLLHHPCLEYALFPWRDYPYYHGWQFLLFPAFALALSRAARDRRQRRGLIALAIVLFGASVQQVTWILRGGELVLEERRDPEGYHLQSRGWSCAAASGTNLLMLQGIASTETEMARLSLVRPGRGGNELGVMRALALKCEGTPQVPVLRRADYDDLVALDRPALVPLSHSLLANHMVLLLCAHPHQVELLDPLTGRESVARQRFEARFLGRAIFLQPRRDLHSCAQPQRG